ncbi:adenylate kinase [Acaryochloris sp. IP29b_bin.148]|uniref:adenylate kinase n=1 Tax=Acaryochloris sp. IP29b_bin.148 TaxID=2969218 RepID=UPI002632ABBE|nr:adenylate kinase [Acaryochloris sp. IP29b_bin.148]
MKKVAVFGNAGGGKSTLSAQLAAATGLPLYVLDKIQYKTGGEAVPPSTYQHIHAQILLQEAWVIDGFGCMETLWPRLKAADTLIYVDLPLSIHFAWVTKRMFTGFVNPPPGWPDQSPILKSSLNSYRNLWLCHRYLTPRYRKFVHQASKTQRVYHLRSVVDISQFLAALTST